MAPHRRRGLAAVFAAAAVMAYAPRGTVRSSNAPFAAVHLTQPVSGAARALSPDAWRAGMLCDVTRPPYSARGDNMTDDTFAIQRAIDDCGDQPHPGGTVLLPAGRSFVSGSLWLRSNLTLRVEMGAVLIGSTDWRAYNMTYTRSGCTMMSAHAALLNAGRCLRMKSPRVGFDDCAEWSRLSNLVISGGGEINGNGDQWWSPGGCLPTCPDGTDTGQRPTLLGLLWVDGLTISGMKLRHSAFWTVHPAFSNNIRIVGNSVWSNGHGTDGIDPDSCWNLYIANNTVSTRDDCIALKSGKDWSGRLVNISTENVLIERNTFNAGHGVAIGSETSGWIRDVVVRENLLNGIEAVVRLKSMRGRGGGIERVLYENETGVVTGQAIQINLVYKHAKPTNASATPIIRDIAIRNVAVELKTTPGAKAKDAASAILCTGLDDSPIENFTIVGMVITGAGAAKQQCKDCIGDQSNTTPKLCINPRATPAPEGAAAALTGDNQGSTVGPAEFLVALRPDFRLRWTIREADRAIDVTMSTNASGWIGFGLSPSSFIGFHGMNHADIVAASWPAYQREPGRGCTVTDYYNDNDFEVKPKLDVELGGTDDVRNASCSRVDGWTSARWSRRLATADTRADWNVSRGFNHVILAYGGSTGEFSYHGPRNTAVCELNFFNGSLAKPCTIFW